jgi:hypothetical protein
MDDRRAVTMRWTPRSEVVSVSAPYTYTVPGPPGAAPLSHFQVVEVTYVDGSIERVPAEDVRPTPGQRSDTAYLVSLAVGVPTVLLTALLSFDGPFGPAALLLTLSSACGCAAAVTGLRSPARRLRVAALVLTLVPVTVILALIAFTVAFVVLILGGGNPNS